MGISQPKAAADPRTTQPSHQHAPSTASSAPSRPPAGVEPTDGGHHRKVSNARMFDNHLHGGLPGRVASIPAHLQHEAHNNGSSCPRSSSGGFTRGAVVEQGMIPTSQRLDGSHSSRYPPSTSSLRVGPANTTISMGSTNKTPMLNSPLTLTSSPTGRGGADGPGAAASSFPISKEGISCSTMMAMMIQQQQQQQHHQLPIVHDPSRSIDSNHRRELSDQEHLGSSLFSLESDDANSEAEEKTLFGPDANRHGQRLPATAGGEAHLLHDGSGSDCSDTVNMRTLLNTSFDARNMMRHSRGLAAKRLDSKVQRTSNNNNNSNGTTNNFRMVVPLTTQRSCGSAVDESSESAVSATWMGSVQFVDEVAKHVNDNIAPRTSTGFRDASGGPMPASSRPRGANSRSTRGVLSIQWMPYELREEEAITPVGTCAHRAQNSGGCSNGRGSGGAANNEVWEASSPHAMAPHFSNLHDGSARASPSSPPLGCDLSSSSPIGILVKRSGGDGGRSNGSWSSGSENCLTSPSSRTNSGAGSRTSKCSTAQVVSVIVPTSTPAAQYISSRRSSTSGSRQHNSAGRGSMASHPATSSGCACISCSTAAAQKPEANIVASTAVWQQASSSSSPHPSPASPLETPVSGDSQTTNNKKMKDGGQSYRSPGVKKEMEVPCRRIRSPIIDGATRHSLQLAKHATADYELFIRALKEKQAVLAKTS